MTVAADTTRLADRFFPPPTALTREQYQRLMVEPPNQMIHADDPQEADAA